ncbi:hypothetical protein POM88_054021 [Heracleum sosnowskyi]|uniref:Xylanase inhibitor C-terminal domain-containing protein n=1 Tax=Heracleum sosnowskyi TaxID=360622 RepID=A0AAD8LX85_9APIA|nr:hypothetical protein POM88_054021 [Heracleum sosnowskyi]
MKKVASVAPFGACYKAGSIANSQTGPVVPYIDIGLAGKQHWRFSGANSMVSVKKDVCYAWHLWMEGQSLEPQSSWDGIKWRIILLNSILVPQSWGLALHYYFEIQTFSKRSWGLALYYCTEIRLAPSLKSYSFPEIG